MLRISLSKAVPVVLVLLVAVPSLQAAEPGRSGFSALSSGSFFARVWDFFTSAWGDNGCELDPDGHCLPRQNAAAATDNGCEVDPNGHCLPRQNAVVDSDNGCEVDPSGRCRN